MSYRHYSQLASFNPETDIMSGEIEAVYAVRIVLVRGPRIQGQRLQQGGALSLGDLIEQLRREFDLQDILAVRVREAAFRASRPERE